MCIRADDDAAAARLPRFFEGASRKQHIAHLQLSLMRAVEEGRYVVRATNSGITAILDPLGGMHAMGSEKDHHALFVPGSLTGTALALQGHTPYFYLHPWLPAAGFVLLLLLCLPVFRQRRK